MSQLDNDIALAHKLFSTIFDSDSVAWRILKAAEERACPLFNYNRNDVFLTVQQHCIRMNFIQRFKWLFTGRIPNERTR